MEFYWGRAFSLFWRDFYRIPHRRLSIGMPVQSKILASARRHPKVRRRLRRVAFLGLMKSPQGNAIEQADSKVSRISENVAFLLTKYAPIHIKSAAVALGKMNEFSPHGKLLTHLFQAKYPPIPTDGIALIDPSKIAHDKYTRHLAKISPALAKAYPLAREIAQDAQNYVRARQKMEGFVNSEAKTRKLTEQVLNVSKGSSAAVAGIAMGSVLGKAIAAVLFIPGAIVVAPAAAAAAIGAVLAAGATYAVAWRAQKLMKQNKENVAREETQDFVAAVLEESSTLVLAKQLLPLMYKKLKKLEKLLTAAP